MDPAPIAVGIPTRGRGDRIVQTMRRIRECIPQPAEIFVYLDADHDSVHSDIESALPGVRVLRGSQQIGPGGGRHQCILASTQPIFVSFDDDSFPVDLDFFQRTSDLFDAHADAAVIGAVIWHKDQAERTRDQTFTRKASFTGCGHALRVSAYRATRGYLPRPIAYGMEEVDLSIQLFAKGWNVFETGELRVFHDTELTHHENPEITAASIANVALFAFLHYPVQGWPRGVLQVINKVIDSLKRGRWKGILVGVLSIPRVCLDFRSQRTPLAWPIVEGFLKLRSNKGF